MHRSYGSHLCNPPAAPPRSACPGRTSPRAGLLVWFRVWRSWVPGISAGLSRRPCAGVKASALRVTLWSLLCAMVRVACWWFAVRPASGSQRCWHIWSRTASDLTVVRTIGVESEMELAFASLHQFCTPMLGRLERLPAPQREALEIVFGLTRGSAPDPFLVGLAVLSLLSETAGERPLVRGFWLGRGRGAAGTAVFAAGVAGQGSQPYLGARARSVQSPVTCCWIPWPRPAALPPLSLLRPSASCPALRVPRGLTAAWRSRPQSGTSSA